MILIFTGPIRSYKTTHLMEWVSTRKDCGGALSPDKDGLRQLYNIKNGKSIAWQKKQTDAPTDVMVGRFVFDGNAFHQAMSWLDHHLFDPEIKTLILDEIGPLELSGKGWDSWVKNAVSKIGDKTLILVVREGLVEKVVAHYEITDYEVLTKVDLPS